MRFEVMSSKIGENENYKIFRKTKDEIEIIEIKEDRCDYLDFVIFYFPITKNICDKIRLLVETYKTNNTICIVGINTDKGEWYKDFDLLDYYLEFSKIFDMAGTINEKEEFEALVDIFYGCRTGPTHGDPEDFRHFCPQDNNFVEFYCEYADTFEDATNKIYEAFCKAKQLIKDMGNFREFSISNMHLSVATTQENFKLEYINNFYAKCSEFGKPDLSWNYLHRAPSKGKFQISLLFI